MFYRGSIRRLDGALDALCREIERCTLTVTPEMLANRQIDELREQSSQLKEFTGQLAFNLGQALERALQKAMPDVMTKAMSPVEERLESLSRNMAREFGSVVSENAGAEIRETSNALLSVKNALLEASRHVEGSGSGLSNQIAEATGDLRAAAKAITEGMNNITKAVRADVDKTRDTLDAQLHAATEGLHNAVQAIRESLDDVGGKMRSSTEEAGFLFSKQIADAVTRIETGTQANAKAIHQALTQLRDTTTTTTGTITGQTNAMVVSMRESAEQMARGVAEITAQIRQRSQEGMAGLTERLVKAAEAMQEASNRNSDRIGEAVGRIIAAGSQAEAGVGKATALVAKTMETQGAEAAAMVVSGAGQILGQFKEGVEDLEGSITRLWERLDKVTATMGVVESKIGQHAQTLDGVNRTAKETEGSLSAAARAMVEAGQPLNQATLALKANIESSARSVEGAVRALEGTQRQSGAISKELTNTLSELQTIWNRHSTRFDKADENLGAAVIKIMDIVDKNTARLKDRVETIDSALAGSVNQLAGNVEELQLAAREFHEGIKAFSQAAQAQRRVTPETRQPRANGAG
jgi:predicted  nucleic acid-binding Zn-ribbon protein